MILFYHSTNIKNYDYELSLLVHCYYTANATIAILYFLHNSYNKFRPVRSQLQKFVFFSATTMTAHCINISYLNAHSNQISLCTEVSFNLKFA